MSTANGSVDAGDVIACTVKFLPRSEWGQAATTAISGNPANAPVVEILPRGTTGETDNVVNVALDLRTLLTTRYWGSSGPRLSVGFLDNPPVELRDRILSHMNAWGKYAKVQFIPTVPNYAGDVRIARKAKDGHWSYLGTDIIRVPMDKPTINLDSFTMDTPDSEFYRVVRHLTGHTLGFPHERMTSAVLGRVDREKAIAYFMAAQGLTRDEVIALILTPQDKSALITANAPDPTSIMSYSLPAAIMKDRVAVLGGNDINATDGQFADSIYQKFPGWQLLDNNPATSSIVADSDALYQMHKSGLIWKYTGTPLTGWQLLDNNPATKKIVAANGKLYQLHNTGKIWKYTGTPITGWQLLDGNTATTDIIASGNDLYQLHITGRIWRYTGTPMTGWQELDNNPATKKIAAAGGNLYQLHKTGLIFKYTGVPLTGWLKLGETAATVDIAAGGSDLYQLQDSGKFLKYTGVPVTGWKQLDNNSATKEIAVGAAGGGIYQILKTGEIWSYGAPDLVAWKQLDGNAAATSIAIGKWPHQLHKTGLIWRYTAMW
ncbi:hypothetical protein Neosp_015045 [[Neocosmospora] mangrovei]